MPYTPCPPEKHIILPTAELLELRQAICEFHKVRYHQNYDPEKETLVTVGGSEAIDLAMRALVTPGDEVIVLDPKLCSVCTYN